MDDLLARCVNVLKADGTAAWLVGGTVRDQLLGRDSHDIDIAVGTGALAIARKLANMLGGAYFPLDVERETGRVVMSDRAVIDVALLRGAEIQDDLAARDFTINALARSLADPGQLIDPFHGEKDLRARIVRAVNDQVFVADPARLMRAIRLAASLDFSIEPHTLALLKRDAPGVQNVAGERLREELLRSVDSRNAVTALSTLRSTGVLDHVLPQAQVDDESQRIIANLLDISTRLARSAQDSTPQKLGPDAVSALLREFADLLVLDLQGDVESGQTNPHIIRLSPLYALAEAIASELEALHFRRDEIQYARGLVQYRREFVALTANPDALSVHRFFRDTGARTGRMGLLLLAIAQDLGQPNEAKTLAIVQALLHNYLNAYDSVIAPRPLLNGARLAEQFGLRGPAIGQTLTQLIEAQVSGLVDSIASAEKYLSDALGRKLDS
jgi:poly(A) polymerase